MILVMLLIALIFRLVSLNSVGLVTEGRGLESQVRQELSWEWQRSLHLQYHDWGENIEQGTELPTAPRVPQHWLPSAPDVCSQCVCVFTAVCALQWVKCRAQILSMGHHTWPHVTTLSLSLTSTQKFLVIMGAVVFVWWCWTEVNLRLISSTLNLLCPHLSVSFVKSSCSQHLYRSPTVQLSTHNLCILLVKDSITHWHPHLIMKYL